MPKELKVGNRVSGGDDSRGIVTAVHRPALDPHDSHSAREQYFVDWAIPDETGHWRRGSNTD